MMYKIKKHKPIREMIAFCLLLVGLSACSPSNTSVSQTEQAETSGSRIHESETSGVQEELPETAQAQGTAQDVAEGFDSPQEAVTAYLERLRAGDLNGMIGTFAADNYIDNYISALESRDISGNGGMTDMTAEAVNMPLAGEFYRDIAVEDRESGIADDILRQYSLLSRLDLDSGAVVLDGAGKGTQFVEQLSKQIQAINLADLKILGFLPMESFLDAPEVENYQKIKAVDAKNYGAAQIEGQVAVVDIGGKKSIMVFAVAEYGGRWYNLQLGGLPAQTLGMDTEAAGTMALDSDDGKKLEREMRQEGLLTSPSNHHAASDAVPVIESEGFDSPEEAAAAYLEGLKANDLGRMMSAFAVESYVENYDLPARLEHVGSYYFMEQEFNLPVADEFSRAINIRQRRKVISDEIAGQFAAVCLLNGDYYGNSPMPEETAQDSDSMWIMADMVNAVDFGSLKILGYIPPGILSAEYDSDGMRELRSSQLRTYGASGLVSCAVAFEIGGNKYIVCPDVAEYNGKWYIKTMNGQLSVLLYISSGLMGTMPIDAKNMPELEDAIVPME